MLFSHLLSWITSFIKKYPNIPIFFFCFLFFGIHLSTLTEFPRIHSDEAWLSGLSRNAIIQGSPFVSEPFFDLYPRTIHSFRILFIGLQGVCYSFFGYHIESFRILSLFFVTLSLFLFYKIIKHLNLSSSISVLGILLFCTNIQVLYCAHFARQEALLLFLLLLLFWRSISKKGMHSSLIDGILISLGIGIHPNSFLLALVCGILYFFQIIKKDRDISNLILLIATVFAGFSFYLLLGNLANTKMISEYLQFGASLGVTSSFTDRIRNLFWFYYRLYHQIGGTYHLYDIKPYFIIFGVSCIALFFVKCHEYKKKRFLFPNALSSTPIFLTLFSLQLGTFLIGRYNQTSIVFSIPFILLLCCIVLERLGSQYSKKLFPFIIIILLITSSTNLTRNLAPSKDQIHPSISYSELGKIIQETIPSDKKVLANLNLGYFFDNNQFYDIRNLSFLEEHQISLSDYFKERDIQYIVLYEELDYIYHTSPKWDLLYGELFYYSELETFLKNNGIELISFENPDYAMRIEKYAGTYPWKTTIYQIKRSPN